jgi:modulator of FtsH protease HflC
MIHLHSHDHDHGHDDDDLAHDHVTHSTSRWRGGTRAALAATVLVGAVLAACAIMVEAGTAVVITRFGDPVRVLTQPGLAWKEPAPFQTAIPVDLRLRTTSTGLQDVGTRDGLRILVQAWLAWQVPDESGDVTLFLRSVRNDPDEAARQLRGFAASALQVTASNFDLADLVNTDRGKLKLAEFETRLKAQLAAQMRASYGIAIRDVGLERLSLPDAALGATVARMRSERETVAAQRTAEGLRAAAEIRAAALRDSRITVANARTEATSIEATARREAADIQAHAYAEDPALYRMLREMDTLAQVVGGNTRMILRTDAAPFELLVRGPSADTGSTDEHNSVPPPVPGSPSSGHPEGLSRR